MEPKLKPIKKEFADTTKKLNEAAKRAVEEMSKRPYSLEQAMKNQARLREENNSAPVRVPTHRKE
jgi:pantoate kinase